MKYNQGSQICHVRGIVISCSCLQMNRVTSCFYTLSPVFRTLDKHALKPLILLSWIFKMGDASNKIYSFYNNNHANRHIICVLKK